MASARDAKTSSRDGWEDADEEEPRGDAIGETEMRHTSEFGQAKMMRSKNQQDAPEKETRKKTKQVTLTLTLTLTITLTWVGTKVIMTKFTRRTNPLPMCEYSSDQILRPNLIQ